MTTSDRPSSFRDTLIAQLLTIADERELHRFQTMYPFIPDARAELLSSIVDYYTLELLEFAPFSGCFAPEEIGLLAVFVEDAERLGLDRWDELREKAARLLERLR